MLYHMQCRVALLMALLELVDSLFDPATMIEYDAPVWGLALGGRMSSRNWVVESGVPRLAGKNTCFCELHTNKIYAFVFENRLDK